jgi:lipid A 4'-phosphatase
MNRAGLIIALVIAAVVGIVFGAVPELELELSRPFSATLDNGHNFGLRLDPTVKTLKDLGVWIAAFLAAPTVAALVLKFARPHRRLLVSGRATAFLLMTLALAPGVLVNLILKEHWDRPRPVHVTQFSGSEAFVPWWDPRGNCPTNCSFVSGDVAGAFWTLAPAALAPPAWRGLAYAGALTVGTGISLLRIIAGAHFITDVVFAGVFTFLVIWIVHGLVYRWPRTRLSDEAVERAIERIALPPHDFVLGFFRQRTRA